MDKAKKEQDKSVKTKQIRPIVTSFKLEQNLDKAKKGQEESVKSKQIRPKVPSLKLEQKQNEDEIREYEQKEKLIKEGEAIIKMLRARASKKNPDGKTPASQPMVENPALSNLSQDERQANILRQINELLQRE